MHSNGDSLSEESLKNPEESGTHLLHPHTPSLVGAGLPWQDGRPQVNIPNTTTGLNIAGNENVCPEQERGDQNVPLAHGIRRKLAKGVCCAPKGSVLERGVVAIG